MSRLFVLICAVGALSVFVLAGDAFGVTINYNGASCCPQTYTEQGVRHINYYSSFGNPGHWHSSGSGAGRYIYGHSSCCSDLGRIELVNGSSFTLSSLEPRAGSGRWRAYNGNTLVGTVTVSGGGTFNFPASFSNITRVDIDQMSGNHGWDNLVVNQCTVTSASAGGPYTAAEDGSFTVTGSGTASGSIGYAWDISGNGSYTDATSQNASVNVANYGWDGPSTRSIGVQLDCAGSTMTASATVNITNADPTLQTWTGPITGDEGSSLSYLAFGSDPSTVDNAALAYTWDWGDGSTSAGDVASHAWVDEGSFTTTVTVEDPQAATDVGSFSVTILNVAPTITSTPALFAPEGQLWTYTPTATDPGVNDVLTWSLGSAPASMTLSSAGEVSWTPGFSESGANTVEVVADDGDGGVTTQSFVVEVTFADDEGDGMADAWETANGLDPTVDDSGADPDGDGLTNLDEFLAGSDPNAFGGPDAPVPTSPLGGEKVEDVRPTVVWRNAVDPDGDELVYEVEVFTDAALTTRIFHGENIEETATTTSWWVDGAAPEDADLWWRVRAYDPWIAGTWSVVERFFVDSWNQAPEVPTPLYPVDGETVGSNAPTATWADALDGDRDPVTYTVRVFDEAGAIVTEASTDGARDGNWTVDTTLSENTWYAWEVRAEDPDGATSPWSPREPFFVSGEDEPPSSVVWLAPTDGEAVAETAPVLRATESVDPEGAELRYRFELDPLPSYDSEGLVVGEVVHSGAGEVIWDLGADGVELAENLLWNGRVRALDAADIGSAWAEITFFVRGPNDAPPPPELIAPESDELVTVERPTFIAGHVQDPEGDAVSYQFRVTPDEAGEYILFESSAVEAGSGAAGAEERTSWEVPGEIAGELYWSARAVDEFGAASDWATSVPFEVATGLAAECAQCGAGLVRADTGAGAVLLLLGVAFGARRRRRS